MHASASGAMGRSNAGVVRKIARILDNPRLYEFWQMPFAGPKMAYLMGRNSLLPTSRVLDVGCGPGSNAKHFLGCDYLGVDLDPRYIRFAQRRYDKHFLVADATAYPKSNASDFDFILLSGILHHLDDSKCATLLRSLRNLLSVDGHIHVLDMVLPDRAGIPRWLARHDRGQFVRQPAHWVNLITECLAIVSLERFYVRRLQIPLLDMIYIKAK